MSRWTRSILGVAAIGLLAIVVVGGSVLVAGTAQAQDAGGRGQYGQVFLTKLASILGISAGQLTANLKLAGQQTVDAAVAAGDMTQAQADKAKERIAKGEFFKGFAPHVGGKRGPGGIVDRQAVVVAVAQRLGLTVEQLQTELRARKTIA